MGNVGKEPEQKTFENGNKIVNTTIATNESWKSKQTGERETKTTWHNLLFRGGLGDVIMNHVKKGDQILVSGKITNRSWEQNGETKYMTEIDVRDFHFTGKKGGDNGSAPQPSAPAPTATPEADDDLPF